MLELLRQAKIRLQSGPSAWSGNEVEALKMFQQGTRNCPWDQKQMEQRSNKIYYQNLCKITTTLRCNFPVDSVYSYPLGKLLLFSKMQYLY